VRELVRTTRGADLVVLPELWDVGYFAFDRYDAEAQPLDGPTVSMLAPLARELGCHIHAGSVVERTTEGALRNTAVVIDPTGSVVLTYSKIHVFGYQSLESRLLQPGDEVRTAGTPYGRVGTTTCYDLRFPELWRGLVDVGAEIVVVPAAWPAARREHWRLLTSARAVEEQVIVIACNAVGRQGEVELAGHSRVVGPWGEVLLEAADDEGIYYCDLDPGVVAATRTEFPVLGDRLSSYDDLARRDPTWT
jgi:predicted amidohydrolase